MNQILLHMGNYNFPQMLFAFCVGFCTMFVLAVDEINDFKACPLPEYFNEPYTKPPTDPNGVTWSIVLTLLFLLFMVSVYIINIMKYAYRELEDGSDDTPSRKSCYNFRVVSIDKVLDGDTIDVTIDLGFDLYKKRELELLVWTRQRSVQEISKRKR